MEFEINFKELGRYLIKKVWIIILTAIVCSFASAAYTALRIAPKYASTAEMYIRNRQSTGFSSNEITAYGDLTKDYMQFLYSSAVLTPVIEDCGLDMTPAALKSRISVSNPGEGRILSVRVTDTDPVRAKEIVDSLCDHFSAFISDMMHEDQVTIYVHGNLPVNPVSPSIKRNIVMAAFLGFLASAGILSVLYVLRGTIDSEESAENILQIKVIGKIPYSRNIDPYRNTKTKTAAHGSAQK